MAKIKQIIAYEILDSFGWPTLAGKLICDNGIEVTNSIPSSSSIDKYSAYSLRDEDESRFFGKGVSRAVYLINNLIAPKLIGVNVDKSLAIDNWLITADGTKNKSKLGSNTILLISQLVANAGAKSNNLPLYLYLNKLYRELTKEKIDIKKIPTPIFNLLSGGKHGENSLDFQEFEVIPSSRFNFSQSLQLGVELYHTLRKIIINKGAIPSCGLEGGFTPILSTNIDALEILKETAMQRKLTLGFDIFFAIDLSASFFYKNDHFIIKDRPKPLKKDEFFSFLQLIIKNYPILLLEDPAYFDDFSYWQYIYSNLPKEIYLAADDLVSGNKERLLSIINKNIASALIIKLSEIGTLYEAFLFVNIARKNNLTYIISHRSNETNDDFIADLAVALQSEMVKFGAPSRGERVAKYNRLWEIEREINRGK